MRRGTPLLVAASAALLILIITLAGPARRPLAVAWWGWRLRSADGVVRVRARAELRAIGRPAADRYWPEVVASEAADVAGTGRSGCVFVGRKATPSESDDFVKRPRWVNCDVFVIERVLKDSSDYWSRCWGATERCGFVAVPYCRELPEGRLLVIGSYWHTTMNATLSLVDAFPIEDEIDARAVSKAEEWLKRL
jgi:hypothetical protein